MNQKIHLIAFCVTSHEQEEDFVKFYTGLFRLADLMDIDFNPQYIVQDAWLASYNAAKRVFPEAVVLMCYFHVVLNCKKNKLDMSPELSKIMFKQLIQRLHMTTNFDHFKIYYTQFVKALYEECPNFIRYFYNQWAASKYI
jgi:hypothetical protein